MRAHLPFGHGAAGQGATGAPIWFEQLGGGAGEEPDAPAGGRLPPAQQRLLRQAYDELYASDAAFRQQVHELLGVALPEAVGKPPQEGLRLAGITGARTFDELPLEAQDYVLALEEMSGTRISVIGVGAARDAVIVRHDLVD